jgi:hypothetical protein
MRRMPPCLRSLLLLPALFLVLLGCTDAGKKVVTTPVNPVEPVISSLVPGRTVAGDTVQVAGRGFGATAGAVLFSAAIGQSTANLAGAWSDSALSAVVPAGAVTGTVQVKQGEVQSAGTSFQVAPRRISLLHDLGPIFQSQGCISCHAGGLARPRLDLTGYHGLMLGNSDHGPVVIPRHAASSLLVRKLQPNPPVGDRMPQGSRPLTDEQILLISDWIDQGARNN